jgi:hypothetical protein
VCVTDGASPAHTGFDTEGVVRRVPTTLAYTGDTGRIGTGNVTMKGTLSDSQSVCDVRGQNISFYVDLNGDAAFTSGELIQTKATSGGTNDSSEAVANPYSLTPGIWLVKLVFTGSTYCAPTSDADGIISVVNPDDAANGGGWYQIGSVNGVSKSVNFGFTTRYDTKAAGYRGQILVHNKQAWRLKGDITAFAKKSSNPGTGEITGTAALFCWDIPTGTWKLADGSVTFKAAFTDTGDNKKTGSTKPDSFTVSAIGGYAPQNACPAAVTPLVQGTQQALKGGNIYIK